jgi:hypothetical protein
LRRQLARRGEIGLEGAVLLMAQQRAAVGTVDQPLVGQGIEIAAQRRHRDAQAARQLMQRRRAMAMQEIDDALPPLRGKQGSRRERNFEKLSHCFVARKFLQVESLLPLSATGNAAKPAMHSHFSNVETRANVADSDSLWRLLQYFCCKELFPTTAKTKIFLFYKHHLMNLQQKLPKKRQ